MLNISPTRVLTTCLAVSCLAWLAMAVASIAVANDEPIPSSQQNQDQQQAQSSQPSDLQLNPPTSDPQPTSDEQSQQQPDQTVNRDAGTDRQAGGSADQQQSPQAHPTRAQNTTVPDWPSPQRDQSSRNSQRAPLRYNTPGASWSDSAPRDQQSRSQQGASLGVNIIRSGEGQGIVITRVHSATPAQQMGLRPSDRITSVNGDPVRSVDAFIATIRGMNPGDSIELGIVRNDNVQTARGELEPYGQSLARNEQPSRNDEFQPYQGIITGSRPTSNQITRDDQFSRDAGTDRQVGGSADRPTRDQFSRDAERSAGRENRQTIYEERAQSDRPRSGDVEARLSRVEQQIDQLSQDLAELRNTVGNVRPSSGLPEAASTDSRPRSQTKPRANEAQPNGRIIQQNDRWNTENRFEQGDLPGARERASQEAARRRANQTGARLQQEERERARDSKQKADQPATDQPPTDQPPK